ncbi:MAG: hypothetical protein AB1715_13915, partial [Acidobacteriota bacterium]
LYKAKAPNEAIRNPKAYFEKILDQSRLTMIRQSEEYRTLKDQLADIVKSRDVAALNEFVSDLHSEAETDKLGEREAALVMLKDLNVKELVAEMTTPTLEELTGRVRAEAEAKAKVEEKPLAEEALEALTPEERAAAKAAEERLAFVEKVRAGLAGRRAAKEAAAKAAEEAKMEEEWFAAGETGEFAEAAALAEAMGTENIREAVDLLAKKVEIGEKIGAAEREFINEAFDRKLLDWNAEDYAQAQKHLEDLLDKQALLRTKGFGNRLGGVFRSKEMKQNDAAIRSQQEKVAAFQKTLEELSPKELGERLTAARTMRAGRGVGRAPGGPLGPAPE